MLVGHSLAYCKQISPDLSVFAWTFVSGSFSAERRPATGSAANSLDLEISPGMRQSGIYSIVQEDKDVLESTALEKLACASRGTSTSFDHTLPEPFPRRAESMWIAAWNKLDADQQPGWKIAESADHLATLALLLLETVKTCTLDAQRVFTETTDRMRIEMSV